MNATLDHLSSPKDLVDRIEKLYAQIIDQQKVMTELAGIIETRDIRIGDLEDDVEAERDAGNYIHERNVELEAQLAGLEGENTELKKELKAYAQSEDHWE